MATSPLFTERKALEKALTELGLWDLPLEMGRLEEGVMAFTAWLPNRDALDVVIKPNSFDEYNQLDIYEETSLADLAFITQLNVRYSKSGINGETTVYFDSFDEEVFKNGHVDVTREYEGSATVNGNVTYRICKKMWDEAMKNNGSVENDALTAILSDDEDKVITVEQNSLTTPVFVTEEKATVVFSS